MSDVTEILDALWRDYRALNPVVGEVWDMLGEEGERPRNDHIALRTYGVARIGIDVLARPFERGGYRRVERYDFPDKKLRAWHFEHDDAARKLPKVFISELKIEELSPALRRRVESMAAAVPDALLGRDELLWSGRQWPCTIRDYEAMRAESEYAGWVAAHGFRANHFTVDLDSLRRFDGIVELNVFLAERGVALNEQGGLVKGSPELRLEQSSTRAANIPVRFDDGDLVIPGCYVEFAKRYALPDGRRFEGFVERSADRIFESTDRDHPRD